MYQLDGGVAIRCHIHRVTGALKTPGEEILDALLVLDDQYSHRLRPTVSITFFSSVLPELNNRTTEQPKNGRLVPIRLLAVMDPITMKNGRAWDEVLHNHARWLEEESSGFRCVLDRETLNEAKMQAVNLQSAIIRGTTFLDADMEGANLSRAVIDGADFQRAILSGGDLSGVQVLETQFCFSFLSGAIFSDAKLRGASFRRASVREGRFQGAMLDGCKFTGAILNSASFHHARIASSDFSECDLEKAQFYRAQVRVCRFVGVSASGANLSSSTLRECVFSRSAFTGDRKSVV